MSEIPPSPVLPTIPYATPDPNRRRRLLTAIGIISICIGSLSLLFNGALTFGFASALSRTFSEIAYYDRTAAQYAIKSAAAAKAEQQAATQPAARALTPDEITAVIAAVQLQCKNAVNRAQTLALTHLLSAPGQQLIDPSIPLDSLGTAANHDTVQFIRAGVSRNGDLFFRPTHGTGSNQKQTYCTLTIDSAGIVQRSLVDSPTGINISTPSTTSHRSRFIHPSAGTPAYRAIWRASVPAFTFATIVSSIHLLIDIVLIAAGILLLKQNPRAAQLHRIYALANPLACFATVAALLWLLAASASRPFPLQAFLIIALIAIPGFIYPITLLILFRCKAQDALVDHFSSGDPYPSPQQS
jgi:hypothetical protein